MLEAGVGRSHHRNPEVAAQEAVAQARQQSGIQSPDLVLVFATTGYDQDAVVRAVRAATGNAPLAGCSAEGTIAGDEADESSFALAVALLSSDVLDFAPVHVSGLKEDATGCGRRIADHLRGHMRDDTAALFLFADGLTFNFDRFMIGLSELIPAGRLLPIFGGTAGDNFAFFKTYQYCGDQVITDGAVAVLMSGPIRIATAVNHGSSPIGGERVVTRCEGNVIYEIDGKPALDVLREYDNVDDWPKTAASFGVGFRAPASLGSQDEFIIRFMPARDVVSGSVTIGTEVKSGTPVWMTRRDPVRIADGVRRIGASIREQLGGNQPAIVFQFDCSGRGALVLREQQRSDLLTELRALVGNADTPWIGLYTYGELGPVGGVNHFHNYTLVLCALY
jgi:hypothetical protein